MTEMISYCGLLCNECPAFIATQTNEPFIQYIPHARKKLEQIRKDMLAG